MGLKIFLGNSPWLKDGYYGVRAGSRWPHFEKSESSYLPFPFFLAYATSLLERQAFECLLVDGIAERIKPDEFYERLEGFRPDVVVYEVATPSIDADLAVAKETKRRLGPEVPVIFCGPDFNMYAPEFLGAHQDVDFVIQGEYEFVLLDVLERMREGRQLSDVAGLISRGADGGAVVNPRRPLEQDLQKFPWPARHHLPMRNYCDLPGGIPAPSLQMWASRGCPFQCIFCSWPQIMYGSSQYRVRDPRDVVDEIAWCIETYGFRSVYFDDDTFNIGKERILELCHLIKEKGIAVPWAVMARADGMDREILAAMKDAGLVALKYGVESGVQEILDATGKNLRLEKVRETVRHTRELGIKFHLTFTFGLPGETIETIRKTIDLALELDPDSLQFSIVTPFPGSRYFEALDRKGYLLSKNWDEYDGYNKAVIRTEHLSADQLEQMLKEANRRWKRHYFIKNIFRKPDETVGYVMKHPFKAIRNYLK